jgi:hypothetical protein
MRRLIFTLCAIGAVAGCAPTGPDPALLQRRAEIVQELAKLDSIEADQKRKKRACRDAVDHLKIGTGADAVLRILPCKPDSMNTTETAAGRRDQLVFEFGGGVSSYLYFTNGVLVAKQL